MTVQEQQKAPEAGVPLGGLGAGCIELDPRGYFRNITINNNRTAKTRIPLSPASFIAIHAASPSAAYTRILQEECGIAPESWPRVKEGALEWRGAYPTVQYRLHDPACPARIQWGAFAPVIPFDHDASTLPAFFTSVHCTNPGPEPLEITVAFNWENLAGQTGENPARKAATLFPMSVEEEEDLGIPGEEEEKEAPAHNAVIYEVEGGAEVDADGQYCLVVRRQRGMETGIAAWNHSDETESRAFWNSLAKGGLACAIDEAGREAECGAVYAAFTLAPGESRRADFALTWYCPRFTLRGHDVGNSYTNHFSSALDVARKTLRHYTYYFKSVESWQARILAATLPRWLRDWLLSCNAVFSTNTLCTRDGRFALWSSAGDPCAGRLEQRLYTTLGTLLFFPRLEESTLYQFAEALEGKNPPVLPPYLLDLSPEEAGACDEMAGENLILRVAHFTLSAYRNYVYTGSLVRIKALLPAVERALSLAEDWIHPGEALPDPGGRLLTYDGLATEGLDAHTASLWIAALRACGRLMELMRRPTDAEAYAKRCANAARAFELSYWDEKEGYYRLAAKTDGQPGICHSGQLAGEWYTAFLGLEPLFDPKRTARALERIGARHAMKGYLASALREDDAPWANPEEVPRRSEGDWLWPAYVGAHYAGLRVYRGDSGTGIATTLAFLNHPHYPPPHRCAHPVKLPGNPEALQPAHWERHASALAAWHLLYAIEGFELCMPERRMRLAPNLPPGTGPVRLPLFTPSCFGAIEYKEHPLPEYEQTVVLTFDSPMSVETVELRVPQELPGVDVQCASAEGELDAEFELVTIARQHYARIHFNSTAQGTQLLKFVVTEGEPKEEEPPEEKGWFRRLIPKR